LVNRLKKTRREKKESKKKTSSRGTEAKKGTKSRLPSSGSYRPARGRGETTLINEKCEKKVDREKDQALDFR